MSRPASSLARLSVVLGLALGLALGSGGLERATAAAVFTVDSTEDGVDAQPGDGHCRTAAGTCTLRAAVMEGNALGGADTIAIPAGAYRLSVGATDGRDATGDLNVSSTLTVRGAGAGITSVVAAFPVDPWWASRDPAFRVEPAGSLTIAGLTIAGDWTRGSGLISRGALAMRDVTVTEHQGSGVYVAAGSARLTDVTVAGNENNEDATGVVHVATGATLAMTAGSIEGNSSLETPAGLYNAGTASLTDVTVSDNGGMEDFPGIHNVGTLSLNGGQVARNGTLNDGNGAAGGIQNYGDLTITGTRIVENSALCEDNCRDLGGGIGNAGRLTMTDALVQGNWSYQDGGGIDNAVGGVMTLTRVSVIGNAGGRSGGGIANHGTATLHAVVIANNINKADGGGLLNDGRLAGNKVSIYGNRAGRRLRRTPRRGGGIANMGALRLTNATIYGNSAVADGAAIYNNVPDPARTVRLTNVTIAANSSSKGASLANATAPELTNTIVSAAGSACTGAVSSHGGNLATDPTCGLGAATDRVTANPRLASALARSNGSFTPVLALLANSPAIDNAAARRCPVKDQRNLRRPVDGNGDGRAACDIGAFEYRP